MRGVMGMLAAGLIAGSAVGLAAPESLWLLVAALGAMAVGGVAVLAGASGRRTGALVVGAVAVFAGGGLVMAQQAWAAAWRPPLRRLFDLQAPPDGAVTGRLTGVLREDAVPRAGGVSLALDSTVWEARERSAGRSDVALAVTDAARVRGGVLVSISGQMAGSMLEGWRAGRTIRLYVRLRRPTRYRNPGAIDEERALARRGFTLVGGVKSAALVEVLAPGGWWSETLAHARVWIRRTVATHVGRLDETAGGIVTAILIGDRAGLSQDVQRTLQEAGTYHVIAISGGNIAILAVVTTTLFRLAGMLGRAALLATIAGFLLFGQLATGGASVDRAIAVAVAACAARALDLRIGAWRALGLAAGVLVAADPLTLVDPGFLLSFGATAGILAATPLSSGWRMPWLIRGTAALLVASAAAEVALLPIVAYFFGRITMAGLLLNLAAIPLMAVVQIAGLLLLPLAATSDLTAGWAGTVAALAARGLVDSASLVSWMPGTTWQVSRPSAWVVAGYYVSWLSAWWLWHRATERGHVERKARWSAIGLASTLVVWVTLEPWTIPLARGDGRLQLIFLDVGQGDATLVRLPRGTTLLVDAGGGGSDTFDVGERVVAPALKWLGVRRLARLIVTHGDVDHAGGAAAIARTFRPMEVWEGVPVPRLTLLQDIRRAADEVGAAWRTVQRHERLTIDGVEIVVHHPERPDWERQASRNDDSIVLELRWRQLSVLLTGDIGRDIEMALVPHLAPAAIRILKVAHHGSRSSSHQRFLEQTRPAVAVVSAGRGNPFGHPAPSVRSRYATLGIPLYRTDLDGAITMASDGVSLAIRTMDGPGVVSPLWR
ncbi:MAG: DNA internalization-related competence protein ComEC/Rec2 [Vicinamibacterales bacterium]